MTTALAYGPRSRWIRDFAFIGAITSLLAPFFAIRGIAFLFGYHVNVPMAYYAVAMLAAGLLGTVVGAVLHRALCAFRPMWLMPAAPLVGAAWGGTVGGLAGSMLNSELFVLSAGCGALAGAMQLGWMWIPYTMRVGAKSTRPILVIAAVLACGLGLVGYFGWGFVDEAVRHFRYSGACY